MEKTGRNVLFIVVFLSSFLIIQQNIPASFLMPPVNEDLSAYGYPQKKWYTTEMGIVNGTYGLYDDINITIGSPYDYSYFELGSTKVRATFFDSLRGREIQLAREYTTWWIFTWHDSLMIDEEFWIDLQTIEKYMVLGNLTQFTMTDSQFVYTCIISYNSTKFSYFSDAWYGTETYTAEVLIFLGMSYEEGLELAEYSVNVFNLIGQILFFQHPYIHPIINTFIAIPIWISIIYLIIRLVLWVISAPLGGGGS